MMKKKIFRRIYKILGLLIDRNIIYLFDIKDIYSFI